MKLLLFTPAFCGDRRHLEMIRVQSLLPERLRGRLSCPIVSAVVVDFCREDLDAPLRQAVAPFDVVRRSATTPQGIRRPTNYAIDVLLRETRATHMVRVIQDSFVDDVAAFSRGIEGALSEAGHWIAAGMTRFQRQYCHQGWCEEMGVPFRCDLDFPQGEVMLAPAETWRQMYLHGLPSGIVHFWDDVMMGELLLHRGGRLIDLPRSWTHRHHCERDAARAVYRAHQAETRTASRGAGQGDAVKRRDSRPQASTLTAGGL